MVILFGVNLGCVVFVLAWKFCSAYLSKPSGLKGQLN